MIISDRAIGIAIEWDKLVYKIPYLFIICMKNVGTIFVYIDTFHILAIYISTQMRALFDY